MKTLRQYIEDQKLAESVRRLGTIAEFQGLKKILSQMYVDALISLVDREDPEARYRAKFINDLMGNIDNTVALGAIAAEAVREQRFENNPTEG